MRYAKAEGCPPSEERSVNDYGCRRPTSCAPGYRVARPPIITVRGRSRRRTCIAVLACYKPGQRSRLIYWPRLDSRPDGRKSFAWSDYRDLLIAAHRRLSGSIMLIWDSLGTRLTAGMRAFIAAQDRLTVVQLPTHAPDLNPVEGIWSPLRRRFPSDVAFTSPEHLIRIVRQGLRTLQYRSDLIDGCLAGTGLALTPALPYTTPRVQSQ